MIPETPGTTSQATATDQPGGATSNASRAAGSIGAPIPPGVRALLDTRVSQLLDEVEGALEVLVRNGFAPLAVPAMRRMLAPTVTLGQAFHLRSLTPERERAVLEGLTERMLARDDASCL